MAYKSVTRAGLLILLGWEQPFILQWRSHVSLNCAFETLTHFRCVWVHPGIMFLPLCFCLLTKHPFAWWLLLCAQPRGAQVSTAGQGAGGAQGEHSLCQTWAIAPAALELEWWNWKEMFWRLGLVCPSIPPTNSTEWILHANQCLHISPPCRSNPGLLAIKSGLWWYQATWSLSLAEVCKLWPPALLLKSLQEVCWLHIDKWAKIQAVIKYVMWASSIFVHRKLSDLETLANTGLLQILRR